MTILLVLAASTAAASVDYLTKKNQDRIGSAQGYLVIYFVFSLLFAFLIHFKRYEHISWQLFGVGAFAGALNFLLMVFVTKALKFGPPGLTFAFLNASAILPSVLLYAVFGPAFQFHMPPTLIIGLCLVVIGLFWSAYQKETLIFPSYRKWVLCAVSAFFIQGLILSIFQWRCLFTNTVFPPHRLIFIICSEQDDLWFMPGLFVTATCLNAIYFLVSQKRLFRKPEMFYGIGAGMLNGVSTYCLLLGALFATPAQRRVLFPLFAICVIILCNIWGKLLYQERVNWKAISLCAMGVLIGSL